MSYQALEIEVIRWAEARGIIQNSNIQAQARKTLEEAGELLEAAAAYRVACACDSDSLINKFREDYRDALADVLITLIIGAATADVDLVDCLHDGYETIKNRTGRLGKDGVFIKD